MSKYLFPRTIDPSLIETGDTIKVTLPKARGVETTLTGTVAKRIDDGATRYLCTDEGATLLAWDSRGNKRVHVLLLHRQDQVQEVLDLFDKAG